MRLGAEGGVSWVVFFKYLRGGGKGRGERYGPRFWRWRGGMFWLGTRFGTRRVSRPLERRLVEIGGVWRSGKVGDGCGWSCACGGSMLLKIFWR